MATDYYSSVYEKANRRIQDIKAFPTVIHLPIGLINIKRMLSSSSLMYLITQEKYQTGDSPRVNRPLLFYESSEVMRSNKLLRYEVPTC